MKAYMVILKASFFSRADSAEEATNNVFKEVAKSLKCKKKDLELFDVKCKKGK